MTGRARALAAVGIQPPDAAVGPSVVIEFSVAEILNLAAVALAASVVGRRAAFDHLAQHVVQRPDKLGSRRVVALGELLLFLGVTAPAVIWRDDHRDALSVVLKGRRIVRIGLVAGIAIHVLFGMGAFFPLLYNARRAAAVAVQAGLAFCGYLGTSNYNQREDENTEKNYKAHGNLRSTTFLLQSHLQLLWCLQLRNCMSGAAGRKTKPVA